MCWGAEFREDEAPSHESFFERLGIGSSDAFPERVVGRRRPRWASQYLHRFARGDAI
jgi:hypothetical protein